MSHLKEEELVLLYYGEPCEGGVREHLAECAECRAGYQKLQRLLNTMDAAPVPERDADYGQRVWQTISAKTNRRASRIGWQWAGALAAAVVIGVGLQWNPRVPAVVQPEPANDKAVQGRVLEAALESHFESSRVVLTELVNQREKDDEWMRDRAENLLFDNRLYRQTAQASGQAETKRLLEDLEEVLVEVAHAPTGNAELRRRIEDKGVLVAIQHRTSREGIL